MGRAAVARAGCMDSKTMWEFRSAKTGAQEQVKMLLEDALKLGYNISYRTLEKGSFEVLGPSAISQTF